VQATDQTVLRDEFHRQPRFTARACIHSTFSLLVHVRMQNSELIGRDLQEVCQQKHLLFLHTNAQRKPLSLFKVRGLTTDLRRFMKQSTPLTSSAREVKS